MKTHILLLLLLLFCIPSLMGQYSRKTEPVSYGFQLAESYGNNGNGQNLDMGIFIEKDNRIMQFGGLYAYEQNRISGAEMHFKRLFVKKGSGAFGNSTSRFAPYFHYNFKYRNSTNSFPNQASKDTRKSGISDTPSTGEFSVRSLEHLAGMGAQIKLFSFLYIDANLGVGANLGGKSSINTNTSATQTVKSKSAFGLSAEIGCTYKFGK